MAVDGKGLRGLQNGERLLDAGKWTPFCKSYKNDDTSSKFLCSSEQQ